MTGTTFDRLQDVIGNSALPRLYDFSLLLEDLINEQIGARAIHIEDGFGSAPGPDFDAVQTNKAVTNNAMTPTIVTIAGLTFTNDDLGKFISISELGAAGIGFSSTIASLVPGYPDTIILADQPSTFVTASTKRVVYGTDVSEATNGVLRAIFATNGSLLSTQRADFIRFPPRCGIVQAVSLNFTDMHQYNFDMRGTTFYGATNGVCVLDGFGMYQSQIVGLHIVGDQARPPTIGIQIGQYDGGDGAGATGLNHLMDIDLRGYFSDTPYVNRGAETTQHTKCNFETSSANAYAMIMDGANHWNTPSQHVDVDIPVDESMSASAQTFHGCRWVARGAGANGIWTSNAQGQKFFGDSYINTLGKAFTFYNVSLRMDSFVFHGALDGPPTHAVFVERTGSTFVYNIDFDIHSNRTTVALFGTSAVSGVCKIQGKITYDELEVGSTLFDDIALWEVNADITVTHPGAAAPVLPSVMTGTLRIAEVKTVIYNAEVQTEDGGSLVVNITSGGDSGTATPGGVTVKDSSNGTGWTPGDVWGFYEFASAETSDSGPGGRLRVAAMAEDSFGGQAALGFWSAPTVGTYLLRGSMGSDGTWQFYGTTVFGSDTATAPEIRINGAVETNRRLRFQTAGVDRISMRTHNAAESGGNAGSNLLIISYADNGTLLYTTEYTRATGVWQFPASVKSETGFYVAGLKVIGERATGWTRLAGTSDKASSWNTATMTLEQLARRVRALEDLLADTHPLLGA